MKASYKRPPNAHPQNGATIGILHRVSKLVLPSVEGNRDIPEVVSPGRPDFVAVSEEVGHETRSEVPGKVDCNRLASDIFLNHEKSCLLA